jgi:hypothetical protein
MPGIREVERSLKQTERVIKSALKEINQSAGKLVVRGEYGAAEDLVKLGRAVTLFANEVEGLQLRWSELKDSAPGKLSERTPLWEYYRPILKALVRRGGEATLSEVEEEVEPLLSVVLQPAEMTVMSGDKLGWKRAVRRSRRHMVDEGFLEPHSGLLWKITESGRRAAEENVSVK